MVGFGDSGGRELAEDQGFTPILTFPHRGGRDFLTPSLALPLVGGGDFSKSVRYVR